MTKAREAVSTLTITDHEFPDEISETESEEFVPAIPRSGSAIPNQRQKLTRKALKTHAVSVDETRAAGFSGRRAFAIQQCEFHGASEYGDPCAKFAHIRPDGKGPYRPGWVQFLALQAGLAVKPIFLLLALLCAYLFLTGHISIPGIHILGGFGNGIL